VAESFFGSLQTERVHITKYNTREEDRRDIADTIEMSYNRKRRRSYLPYLSPMAFEKRWYKKNQPKKAVHIFQTRSIQNARKKWTMPI